MALGRWLVCDMLPIWGPDISLQNPCKFQGVVKHAYHLHAGEVKRQVDPWVYWHKSLTDLDSRKSRRYTVSKECSMDRLWNDIWEWPLNLHSLSSYRETCTYIKFKDFLYVYSMYFLSHNFNYVDIRKECLEKSTFSSCVKWMFGYMSTIFMFVSD